jgi:hypothetical protein
VRKKFVIGEEVENPHADRNGIRGVRYSNCKSKEVVGPVPKYRVKQTKIQKTTDSSQQTAVNKDQKADSGHIKTEK